MAESKQFDINKVENFLKNSADKAQTLRYWNAAVELGKTVKEIDENLASNVDDKQIADLLLRRTDAKKGEIGSLRLSKMLSKSSINRRYPKSSQR